MTFDSPIMIAIWFVLSIICVGNFNADMKEKDYEGAVFSAVASVISVMFYTAAIYAAMEG